MMMQNGLKGEAEKRIHGIKAMKGGCVYTFFVSLFLFRGAVEC